jgi:hypothetical protein
MDLTARALLRAHLATFLSQILGVKRAMESWQEVAAARYEAHEEETRLAKAQLAEAKCLEEETRQMKASEGQTGDLPARGGAGAETPPPGAGAGAGAGAGDNSPILITDSPLSERKGKEPRRDSHPPSTSSTNERYVGWVEKVLSTMLLWQRHVR